MEIRSTDNMKIHKTTGAKAPVEIPAAAISMKADEICAAVWTESFRPEPSEEAFEHGPLQKAIHGIMGAVQAPNWKDPFVAAGAVDANGIDAGEWVKAAITWFHGATARVTPDGKIMSPGYQAW